MSTIVNRWNMLCTPSKVYVVLALIGIAISLASVKENAYAAVFGAIASLLLLFLWTWLIQAQCDAGRLGLSWLLVFLPIILQVVFFGGMLVRCYA